MARYSRYGHIRLPIRHQVLQVDSLNFRDGLLSAAAAVYNVHSCRKALKSKHCHAATAIVPPSSCPGSGCQRLLCCAAAVVRKVQMYIGSNMIICVADPAAARRMLSTLSYRHSGIQLTAGKEDWDFLLDSVVGAK